MTEPMVMVFRWWESEDYKVRLRGAEQVRWFPTDYSYQLYHKCPVCRARRGQLCDAPRKGGRFHVARQDAGRVHYERDLMRAPWLEDRVPGVRYDSLGDFVDFLPGRVEGLVLEPLIVDEPNPGEEACVDYINDWLTKDSESYVTFDDLVEDFNWFLWEVRGLRPWAIRLVRSRLIDRHLVGSGYEYSRVYASSRKLENMVLSRSPTREFSVVPSRFRAVFGIRFRSNYV